MTDNAVTLLGVVVTVVGALFGFTLAQDRRLTRLEERLKGFGSLLQKIPKRKDDRRDD